MSYCAFQNTVQEMEQCVEKVDEAIDEGSHDWDDCEVNALDRLKELSRNLLESIEEFEVKRIGKQDEVDFDEDEVDFDEEGQDDE
jgi:hypothetical protein